MGHSPFFVLGIGLDCPTREGRAVERAAAKTAAGSTSRNTVRFIGVSWVNGVVGDVAFAKGDRVGAHYSSTGTGDRGQGTRGQGTRGHGTGDKGQADSA